MDVGIYSILSKYYSSLVRKKKNLLGHKNRMQSSESSFPLPTPTPPPPPKKKKKKERKKMGDEKNIHSLTELPRNTLFFCFVLCVCVCQLLKIVNSKNINAAAKIDARENEQLQYFFTWP